MKTSSERKQPVMVYLELETVHRLEALAEREQRSVSWVMRELILRALPEAEQAERM